MLEERGRDLWTFLILQVGSILWAIVSFQVIPNKEVAGAIAGGCFLTIGVYMLYRVWTWGAQRWRMWMVYPLLAYVLGCMIPMLVTRFSQPGKDFSQIRILGLPSAQFHRVSSTVALCLILFIGIDLWRSRRARQNAKK